MATPAVDPARYREVIGSFATGVAIVTAQSEQGLLGFALHPSYPRLRMAYAQHTFDRNGSAQPVEDRGPDGTASAPRARPSPRRRP